MNAEKLFHDYKYDAEDNLYEVAERVDFTNNRTYTRTFDKRNRLKSSTDAYSKTVAFTYDSANNLKSLTDAGSKVTNYNYDSQNRLDTVAQNSSTIADYDWYSDGLLKQVKYSETSKRDYNYDNADRVSNITNTIGTGSESFDYGYDLNSNRETETRNIDGAVSKTIAYDYDQLNRLESASYTANSATNQLSYTYDAVGNRKTESGTDQNSVAISKTADYDDLDRLTQLTDGSLVSDFEYDDNSNLTKVKLNGTDNETFEYDIRNQLSKYTSIGNGISADYDYDFERKRLSKTVSGDRRDYVYAGNQVINEYVKDTIVDTSPVLNASYGIGSGEIVKSDFVGEGSRNYFSDALGSITSLADTSSSLISRNDYDSFGEIVASSGVSQNAVTYTGQRLDVESGLMALGNGERYYNPSYGRFIQQDSYAGMPDLPQSLNRFSYGYNNPNINTDPTGNYVESLWDLASLAVGVYSFQDNIRKGNYGWAALDAVGIVADTAALLLPVVPGGVGIAIKSYRAVDATVTVIQGTDRAINTGQAIYNAGDSFGKGDVKTGLLNTGFALLGGKGASESYNRYNKVNKVKTDVNSAQKATDEATDLLTAKNNPKALMEITQKEAKIQNTRIAKSVDAKPASVQDFLPQAQKRMAETRQKYGFNEVSDQISLKAGEKIPPKNVALGLRVDRKGNKLLEPFAKDTNSIRYPQWDTYGLIKTQNQPFVKKFYEALYNSIGSGGKIKFNLDFLDLSKSLKTSRFSDPFDVGATNWELQQILNNKLFYNNTEFFIGKDKLNLQDIKEFGLEFIGEK